MTTLVNIFQLVKFIQPHIHFSDACCKRAVKGNVTRVTEISSFFYFTAKHRLRRLTIEACHNDINKICLWCSGIMQCCPDVCNTSHNVMCVTKSVVV